MKPLEVLVYLTAWDYQAKRSHYLNQSVKKLIRDETERDESLVFDSKTIAKETVATLASPFIVMSRFTGVDLALKTVRRELAKVNK